MIVEPIFVLAGMAGNQVLEWPDLDSEIKTAGLKDVSGVSFPATRCFADRLTKDPLAPPDLYAICCYGITSSKCDNDFRLIQGNMRVNWRAGKSICSNTAADFDKVCLAALSYRNENLPIAYVSEQPQCMLAVDYTAFACTDTVFPVFSSFRIYEGDIQ